MKQWHPRKHKYFYYSCKGWERVRIGEERNDRINKREGFKQNHKKNGADIGSPLFQEQMKRNSKYDAIKIVFMLNIM